MKLDINSEIWANLFPKLRDDYFDHTKTFDRGDMERHFWQMHNIKIEKCPASGRWEGVEFCMNDCELTVFLLKWS